MASRLTAGHALSVGWVDDDVAVEAHLQAVVLADVGVVPVDAVVGEPQPVDELAADGDRGLGLVGHAVVGVLQPEAVPVHGGFVVAVVADPHRHLRALCHAQGRAGDGAVVGEHAHAGIAELVDDGGDAQVVGVAVAEFDDGARAAGGEAVDGGREAVVVDVGGGHAAPPRASRSGRRSSGTAMGEKALTSAPPVLPTG